jgi:predicted RNA-binding Zn-ribbon protein involved in translation (DUF1610 family)
MRCPSCGRALKCEASPFGDGGDFFSCGCGVEGWAWAGTHRTFFPYHVREGVRVWPCPACGEEYRRLVDAMEHFAAAHPERTGGFAKEFDLRTRTDYWRSWQGYVCPRCGRLSDDPTKHSCGDGR